MLELRRKQSHALDYINMELERVGSKALAVAKADQKNLVPPKPQKKVLDEDAYTEVSLHVDSRPNLDLDRSYMF